MSFSDDFESVFRKPSAARKFSCPASPVRAGRNLCHRPEQSFRRLLHGSHELPAGTVGNPLRHSLSALLAHISSKPTMTSFFSIPK
jgi:hypothetical protein